MKNPKQNKTKHWEIIFIIMLVIGFVFGTFFGLGIGINSPECSKKEINNLIYIQIVATIEEDFKKTNSSIVSDLVCNLETKVCGNEMYYNENKGFFWGGFPENISGMEVNAYLRK